MNCKFVPLNKIFPYSFYTPASTWFLWVWLFQVLHIISCTIWNYRIFIFLFPPLKIVLRMSPSGEKSINNKIPITRLSSLLLKNIWLPQWIYIYIYIYTYIYINTNILLKNAHKWLKIFHYRKPLRKTMFSFKLSKSWLLILWCVYVRVYMCLCVCFHMWCEYLHLGPFTILPHGRPTMFLHPL